MRKAPSPTIPTTRASGRASFAPIAAGTQYPMQLKSVGEMKPRGRWIGRSSAARNVWFPSSTTTQASSARRLRRAAKKRAGLTRPALSCASHASR